MKKMSICKVALMVITSIMALLMIACGSKDIGETIVEVEAFEEESKEMELAPEDVIAIAEEGFRAIKELNPEKIIKYTNIELLYHMGRDELTDDETMLEEISALAKEMDEDYNSLGIVGHYAVIDNIELHDSELIAVEEINELNAMLSDDQTMFKGLHGYQYNIEKAYKLQMSYESMGEEKDSYVLVVCANGDWELDICIAVVRDIEHMIMQMK